MCIELKIKAKHLALEPAIIRKEEARLKKLMKHNRGEGSYWQFERKLNELALHRRWNVRNESRATNLARAYLAGKPYNSVELMSRKNYPMFYHYIVPRIVAMVTKYGIGNQRKVDKTVIEEWYKQTGV